MKRERHPYGYWTAETVKQELQNRKDKGLSLGARKVLDDHSSLYYNARKHYGGWFYALEAIGEDVGNNHSRKKREDNGYWTAEQVVKEIKKLQRKGEDLTTVHTRKNHGSLVSQASIHYGGWYPALEASGIRAEDYRLRKEEGYWTKATVKEAIEERVKMKLSIDSLEVKAEDSSLYRAALRLHGKWFDAVTASGVSPDNYRRRNGYGYWNAGRVLKELIDRNARGKSLLPGEILTQDRTLYDYARQIHGSYREALNLSGFDANDYYERQEPKKQEQV